MNCSFCKREIEAGRGSVLVRRDGKLLRFCSSKCRKNYLLGRNPSKVKWVRGKKNE